MASRRMFSMDVVDTDNFLEMPLTAQCLYFHLGMRADDDGFIDAPKRILRYIGSNNDDLKILLTKGYLIPFEDGVVVIRDWLKNNQIRADRKKSTRYTEKLSLLAVEKDTYVVNLYNDNQLPYQMTTKCQPSDNQVTYQVATNCQPSDNQVTYQMSTNCQPIVNQVTTKCQPTANQVATNVTLNNNNDQLATNVMTFGNQMSTNCQPSDNQVSTNCQPSDNQVTTKCHPQDRLGKDSIGYNIVISNDITRSKVQDNQNEKKRGNTPYQEIVDMYNNICVSLPRVTKLSEARKKAIRARYNQYDIEDFKRLFETAEGSSFLKGGGGQDWVASFDWLIKDSNMAKVLDGNYIDRHTEPKKSYQQFKEFSQRTCTQEEMDELEKKLLKNNNVT